MIRLRILLFCWIGLCSLSAWSETITLFATGNTQGRLEQCGCATDIEGGLEARAGFLQEARGESPNTILVDLGGFMPLKNEKKKPAFVLPNESDLKANIGETTLGAMQKLQYDVVLAALPDLAYGPDLPKSFVGSNGNYVATQIEDGEDWLVPQKTMECGGLKIAFIGAASLNEKKIRFGNDTLLPASQAIPPVLERLRANDEIDVVILLAHEPPPTVKRWLTANPDLKIDLVITLDFGIRVDRHGETWIVNAPGKGRTIGKIVLDIKKSDGVKNVQFERVPLDPQQYRNPSMRAFLTESYSRMIDRLKLPLQETDPTQTSDNAYLGVDVCMGCHMEEYEQWSHTRHASAYLDLLEQTRHWVPECVRCHVTGFGQSSGFRQFPQSNNLAQVQCESCHGPGQKHVDEFGIGSIQRVPDRAVCTQCHTPKFSLKFESIYDLYYKKVVHQKP